MDYDCRALSWRPFRSVVKAGETAALQFQVRNGGQETVSVAAVAALPEGWTAAPERRRARVPGGTVRRMGFRVGVPGGTAAGRYVLAADVEADGELIGEAAAALVDVT